ncbi:transposase [Stieleria sp. JC731]|uniref:transposase n=1 Tax=Pirellulaceae TaxID=2691357 RepID=UPI003965781C
MRKTLSRNKESDPGFRHDDGRCHKLLAAMRNELKTGRVWAIKENFRHFWMSVLAFWAEGFFGRWYGWAIRSRLEPIKNVTRMPQQHLDGMLTYFRNRITEGFNSRTQVVLGTSPTTDWDYCSTVGSSKSRPVVADKFPKEAIFVCDDNQGQPCPTHQFQRRQESLVRERHCCYMGC